jgi:hypothetical protein
MKKCEFSETQFVIGYSRELFNSFAYFFPFHYEIYAPSTKEEKRWASDLILRHYNGRRYRFSEFYQFKRSKYFDSEVFSDLSGKTKIDTSVTPKHGFNIYNTKATRQFNTLQKLAKKRKYRVYYCAPMFHTLSEYNRYFSASNIQNNSKVFNLSQKHFQSAKIALDSNHTVIFDRNSSHICSDPIEIESSIASERNITYQESQYNENPQYSLERELKELHSFAVEEINNLQLNENFEQPEINLFEVRDMLITYFNIHWFPFLTP